MNVMNTIAWKNRMPNQGDPFRKGKQKPLPEKPVKITAEMKTGLRDACRDFLMVVKDIRAGETVLCTRVEKAVEGIYRALNEVKKTNSEFTLADGPSTFGIHVGIKDHFGITCQRLINLRITFLKGDQSHFYIGDTRNNLDQHELRPMSSLNKTLREYAQRIADYKHEPPEHIERL